MKEQVLEYYQIHKRIKSPIFGEIKVTPQSLWHLENKDKNHKRTEKEILIRNKCFLLIDKIIEKSHLYQEYKQEEQNILIKKKWKKSDVSMKLKYYWLIWIIEAYKWHWIRIKVVIKKVAKWSHYEFVSVYQLGIWNDIIDCTSMKIYRNQKTLL